MSIFPGLAYYAAAIAAAAAFAGAATLQHRSASEVPERKVFSPASCSTSFGPHWPIPTGSAASH
jgi:hypothetical protein